MNLKNKKKMAKITVFNLLRAGKYPCVETHQ
jgi:hypothetical protein